MIFEVFSTLFTFLVLVLQKPCQFSPSSCNFGVAGLNLGRLAEKKSLGRIYKASRVKLKMSIVCRIPQRSFCIMDLNMTKIKRPLMLHILLHLGIYVTRNLIYFCCCIYVLGRYGIQIYLVKIAISFTKAIIMYSVFEIHTLLHQVNLLTRI